MTKHWLSALILCVSGLQASAADGDTPLPPRRTLRPELAYSSYLGGRDGGAGGRAVDSANAAATDAAGMLYTTGFTMSLDFPVLNPIDRPVLFSNGYYYEDVFITKIDPYSGALVYSTILGGPGTDIGNALAVDRAGAVYVAGRAGPDFPYTKMLGRGCEAGNRTAFVLKLAPGGDRLEWAACLCAGAYATALAPGEDGSVHAAGYYQGSVGSDSGLPVTEGAFQTSMPPSYAGKSFVVKLNADGDLVYATWLAGNGDDKVAALAAGANGEALVLGMTTSNTFPVVNALQDRNRSGGGVGWSGDGGQAWQPRNAGLDHNILTQVAADPHHAGTAYVCSNAAGIQKTTDFGQSWRSINQGIPLSPSPNVAMVAPSRAAQGVLYAVASAQLVRSSDGGQNWEVIPLQTQPVAVWPDPKRKDTLYVLVVIPPPGGSGQPSYSLIRTDTASAPWTRISTDLRLTASSKVVADPSREGVLYLAGSGYFRSADRGETWTPMMPPPPLAGPIPLGMQSLAPDPRQPGVLYADLYQVTASGMIGALARSADDGQTWTPCGTFPEQALSFWVDAAQSNVIFVMTRNAVYRSADSCATFEPRTEGLPGRTLLAAAQDPISPENLYVTASPAPDLFVTRLAADGTSAVFSTYLGTRDVDYPAAATLDAEGGLWLTGYTASPDWPVTPDALAPAKAANEDVFLSRLNAAGDALTYSTYLGGNGLDLAAALAVSPAGEVWVAGATRSANFPLAGALQESYKGGQADAFVTCLANQGRELAFSTYLGGTGTDLLAGLQLDGTGGVVAAGTTNSADWPVAGKAFQPAHSGGAAEEAVVVRLSLGAQAGVTLGGGARPGEEDEDRPPAGRPRVRVIRK